MERRPWNAHYTHTHYNIGGRARLLQILNMFAKRRQHQNKQMQRRCVGCVGCDTFFHHQMTDDDTTLDGDIIDNI